MAKIVKAFVDANGRRHVTAEAAALADLSALVLGSRAASAVHSSIAQLMLEKRAEIERVYAELDANLLEEASEVVDLLRSRKAR